MGDVGWYDAWFGAGQGCELPSLPVVANCAVSGGPETAVELRIMLDVIGCGMLLGVAHEGNSSMQQMCILAGSCFVEMLCDG
jgi:hypothetical protein